MIHYLLAVLALAPASAPPAGAAGLACIEETVTAPELGLALELGGRDGKNPTPAEAAAQANFLKANAACRERHGWSQSQDQAAVLYALGGAAATRAREKLRGYGIDPAMLDRLAAGLSPAERTAALNGDGSAVTARLLKLLSDAGFKMARDTEEEWKKLGFIFGQGVGGILMRDKAKALFAAEP